jgi:hypothetical protein
MRTRKSRPEKKDAVECNSGLYSFRCFYVKQWDAGVRWVEVEVEVEVEVAKWEPMSPFSSGKCELSFAAN